MKFIIHSHYAISSHDIDNNTQNDCDEEFNNSIVDTVIQHINKSLGLDCIMLHSANLFQFNEGIFLFSSRSDVLLTYNQDTKKWF